MKKPPEPARKDVPGDDEAALKKIKSKKSRLHRRINNVATVAVVLFAFYIALVPFWPALKFQAARHYANPSPYNPGLTQKKYKKPAASDTTSAARTDSSVPAAPSYQPPADNRIVIPSALINQPIYEGSSLSVINNGGTWRKNLWAASPEENGNTVIIGHRFTYKNPEGAFYNLDKVKIGDTVAIYWHQKELIYQVEQVKAVSPDSLYIENNTPGRQLTLYTCTPLITATNRLVVIAKPLEAAQ